MPSHPFCHRPLLHQKLRAVGGILDRGPIRPYLRSVAPVRENPDLEGGMAPIYGMAAAIPDRSFVHEMLRQVMDAYYRL